MATLNPFDLLGNDESEDPLQLVKLLKIEPKKVEEPAVKPTTKAQAQSKPNTQAVKEGKSESNQGSRGGGRGYGRERGTGGSYRDSNNYGNSYGNKDISADQRTSNERDDGKPFERRGGYGRPRSGFGNGDSREGDFDRPRRPFDRRNGTGRGSDMKPEGSGQGYWGAQNDELTPVTEEAVKSEKNPNLNAEKTSGEEAVGDKEAPKNETEKEKPEDKEMTLEEYEKILEGKRKALQSLKTEGRKIDVKEFESMQQLSNKKASDDIFVKLGSEKDKKKELAEKEERAKKSVSINEFLKPAEGERNYGGGRGRGRGRGEPRGGGHGGIERGNVRAPAIEDPGQFPTLGGK